MLKSGVCEELDSRPLRDELQHGQPTRERKLALWNQLKLVAVARSVAYVLGGVHLGKYRSPGLRSRHFWGHLEP